MPLESGEPPKVSFLNSNAQAVREDLPYSKQDLEAVIEWVKRHCVSLPCEPRLGRHHADCPKETTWHSLGTCSMAPKEGNSIVKHGVLDERLNVHGVKGTTFILPFYELC